MRDQVNRVTRHLLRQLTGRAQDQCTGCRRLKAAGRTLVGLWLGTR